MGLRCIVRVQTLWGAPIFWYEVITNIAYSDVPSKGDGDPVDVVEIGSKAMTTGMVAKVKVLGCLALLDENETDWKVIAIREDESNDFNSCEDVADVVHDIMVWFRDYKIPDGKPANSFANDGKPLDVAFTHAMLDECHQDWKRLVAKHS